MCFYPNSLCPCKSSQKPSRYLNLLIKKVFRYFNRQVSVALLRRVLAGDKTFVILPLIDDHSRYIQAEDMLGQVGLVAEVVMSAESDPDDFKVIAEGRQRCQVVEYSSNSTSVDGVKYLTVRILSDNNLEYNLFEGLSYLFSSPMVVREACKSSRVPLWMAKANNVFLIMKQIRNILSQLFMNESGMAKLSDDPSDFSFLVASFLPLSNRIKHRLLTCSCALHRLKLELEFLRKCEFLHCIVCRTRLASMSEIIVMSSTGALASYVNPGGIIYETLTLNKMYDKVLLVGRPQTENRFVSDSICDVAQTTACSGFSLRF